MIFKRLMAIALSLTLTACFVLSANRTLAGPLDQIIAGAKKEGTVTVKLKSSFTPKSM